jgi:hypothetical protein
MVPRCGLATDERDARPPPAVRRAVRNARLSARSGATASAVSEGLTQSDADDRRTACIRGLLGRTGERETRSGSSMFAWVIWRVSQDSDGLAW